MHVSSPIVALAAALGLTLSHGAAAGTAYVPLGSASEILVIDTTTDRVVRAIPGVDHAHGLGGTSRSPYLVAGSFSEALPGEATIGPRPAGMTAEEHAAHHAPAGRPADGAQKPVSVLMVLRVADGAVVRLLDAPGAIHHVAVSPHGRYAVATHTLGDGISVTDLTQFTVSELIPTGTAPNYVVFSSDGAFAYVSNTGDGTVSELDTDNWQVRRTMPAGSSPEHIVLASDDRTLYVVNVGAGTVSVLGLDQGAVTQTFEIGGELHGLDLSDDGRTLFVSGRGEDELVAIDLASGHMRSRPLSPAPYHLAVVRGTGKLYVSSSAAPSIWVIDQTTLALRGTIPIRGEGHQMVVLP
jgi:YVTN family beta-propeller protein